MQKPAAVPPREAQPRTPLQVEALARDIDTRGYEMSAVLVRVTAYTGMRPQEALALYWRAIGTATVLQVELANTTAKWRA